MNPLNRVIELLTARPLTAEEGERMCEMLASGPLTPDPCDQRLIALGLVELYDENANDATSMAHRFFYAEDGTVRQPFRWF